MNRRSLENHLPSQPLAKAFTRAGGKPATRGRRLSFGAGGVASASRHNLMTASALDGGGKEQPMTRSVSDRYEEPMSVSVRDGEVVVLGPGPINGAFTPAAARESGLRLIAEATKLDEKPLLQR